VRRRQETAAPTGYRLLGVAAVIVLQEIVNLRLDLVADLSCLLKDLLFGSGKCGGIIERPVQANPRAGKIGHFSSASLLQTVMT
jgi:hypothetical protein